MNFITNSTVQYLREVHCSAVQWLGVGDVVVDCSRYVLLRIVEKCGLADLATAVQQSFFQVTENRQSFCPRETTHNGYISRNAFKNVRPERITADILR